MYEARKLFPLEHSLFSLHKLCRYKSGNSRRYSNYHLTFCLQFSFKRIIILSLNMLYVFKFDEMLLFSWSQYSPKNKPGNYCNYKNMFFPTTISNNSTCKQYVNNPEMKRFCFVFYLLVRNSIIVFVPTE